MPVWLPLAVLVAGAGALHLVTGINTPYWLRQAFDAAVTAPQHSMPLEEPAVAFDRKVTAPAEKTTSPGGELGLLRTTASVRLRERPSTDAPIVMIVGSGVSVEAIGQEGVWQNVRVASRVGWIREDYLTAPNDVPKSGGDDALRGRASVIDGDTIELLGQKVRFNGIDAPESAQQCEDAKGFRYQCGAKAATALDEFLAKSRPVRCEFVEWDQYGRYVGNCFRADGKSVAAWLVENGHALDWPKYSGGAYAAQQATAREAKRGIWIGTFQEPWAWRANHRSSEQSTITSPFGAWSGGCNIKGNISDKGERIYHVPGQAYYDKTRISTGKGERWFCSEQEARNAGWRKARR